MFYLILLIVIIIIFFFSSKTLSPIPYFPSQPADLPIIIKALNLKNDQTIIDLGAGDGIIIFDAAKSAFQKGLNTNFVAVEINPILILILYFRRLFHPNRRSIKIVRDDIFNMNFSQLTMKQLNCVTIYLYISPWHLEETVKNCKLKIKNFKVVSYMYPVKSLKNKQETIQGKNKIFVY